MVTQFDFQQELAALKRRYEEFLLPVFICDAQLEVLWHNYAASELYPGVTGADGVRRLLGGFDTDNLIERLERDEVLNLDGAPAFTGVKLSLTPVISGGKVHGVMVMMVGPQAVISPSDVAASSKTYSNINASIRNGVEEIFNIIEKYGEESNLAENLAARRAFDGIGRSGYRLFRIAVNISTYSRFQTEPPRPCGETRDIFDFIRGSRFAVSSFAKETGISVSFDLPDERYSAVAEIDESHLQLVYSNLINNAFYFTKPGNSVKITGRLGKGRILFTVMDKGVGIPKALLPDAVLKPYFSYGRDNKPAGIGLGLALVKMVADGCGGSISVTSKENEWTAATFILPLREPVSGIPLRQETSTPKENGYGHRFSYASISLRTAAGSPFNQNKDEA